MAGQAGLPASWADEMQQVVEQRQESLKDVLFYANADMGALLDRIKRFRTLMVNLAAANEQSNHDSAGQSKLLELYVHVFNNSKAQAAKLAAYARGVYDDIASLVKFYQQSTSGQENLEAAVVVKYNTEMNTIQSLLQKINSIKLPSGVGVHRSVVTPGQTSAGQNWQHVLANLPRAPMLTQAQMLQGRTVRFRDADDHVHTLTQSPGGAQNLSLNFGQIADFTHHGNGQFSFRDCNSGQHWGFQTTNNHDLQMVAHAMGRHLQYPRREVPHPARLKKNCTFVITPLYVYC